MKLNVVDEKKASRLLDRSPVRIIRNSWRRNSDSNGSYLVLCRTTHGPRLLIEPQECAPSADHAWANHVEHLKAEGASGHLLGTARVEDGHLVLKPIACTDEEALDFVTRAFGSTQDVAHNLDLFATKQVSIDGVAFGRVDSIVDWRGLALP